MDIHHPAEPGPRQPRDYPRVRRMHGGLLLVLQGVLVIVQGLLLASLPLGRWWTPAGLLPLYMGYFIVRGPLWRGLYRSGELPEPSQSLTAIRVHVWTLPVVTAVSLTWHWQANLDLMAVPAWIAIAWSLGMWAVLAVRGVYPVDFVFWLVHSIVLPIILRVEPLATEAAGQWLSHTRLVGLPLMTWGFSQHSRFHSVASADGQSDPNEAKTG